MSDTERELANLRAAHYLINKRCEKLERKLHLYLRLVAALNLAYVRLTDKAAREEIGALLREIEELERE